MGINCLKSLAARFKFLTMSHTPQLFDFIRISAISLEQEFMLIYGLLWVYVKAYSKEAIKKKERIEE